MIASVTDNKIDRENSYAMEHLSGGSTALTCNDKYGFSDKTDDVIMPVKSGDRVGFINSMGKVVIPFIYKDAHNFSEGLSFVKNWRYWGAIDKTGKNVIPYMYNSARPFSEGLAAIRLLRKCKWGFIDKSGKVNIPFIYDSASDFSQGVAKVKIGRNWIFIDKNGKVAATMQKRSHKKK